MGEVGLELCFFTPDPLPTARVPKLTSPLRCPTTMPHCLRSNGCFPSPPNDSNGLPHYEDLFPPKYTMACCLVLPPNPQSLFHNPPSFILDPTPTYSFVDPDPSSESSDSDGFLPFPLTSAMTLTQSNPLLYPNLPQADKIPNKKGNRELRKQ